MKKKKFLTLVATGLMACLVAAMGGMTYSKYITTTETGKQTATAAEWGFVLNANTTKLFGDAYNKGSESSAVVTAYADGVSVKADTEDKFVVAPGTSGSMTIAINGTAEVKAQLKIKASDTPKEISVGTKYYPIKWTLTDGTDANTVSGKLSEVLTAFASKSATIEATKTCDTTYTLSWEWALEDTNLNNVYDTMIGYKSAGKAWTAVEAELKKLTTLYGLSDMTETDYNSINNVIEFNIDVTIEQIQ